MPQFMLLLHEDPKAFADISPAEMGKVVGEYRAWGEKVGAAGRYKGGNKLTDEGGKHLTSSKGKLKVVDGPYAEVKEIVGGYHVIEAGSYEQAVELAKDHPHLKYGLKIELRQIDAV